MYFRSRATIARKAETIQTFEISDLRQSIVRLLEHDFHTDPRLRRALPRPAGPLPAAVGGPECAPAGPVRGRGARASRADLPDPSRAAGPPPLSVTLLALGVLRHDLVEGAPIAAVLVPRLRYFGLTIALKQWGNEGYGEMGDTDYRRAAGGHRQGIRSLSIEWAAPAQGVPNRDALRPKLLQAAPSLRTVDLLDGGLDRQQVRCGSVSSCADDALELLLCLSYDDVHRGYLSGGGTEGFELPYELDDTVMLGLIMSQWRIARTSPTCCQRPAGKESQVVIRSSWPRPPWIARLILTFEDDVGGSGCAVVDEWG
ncbi:hypothetical protein DFH07DRAFT_781321 [Mycena maculata]|uniref:Uncharacterized protein n=1 Tax=Mycena maculata TaxID=230809 RepID=A0AAD7HZP6_9AGAR|nr:hypothetical protein DFH07DRAFT_781321 [Mycena maculata]